MIGKGKNLSETLLGDTFQWWCQKGTGAELRLAIVFGLSLGSLLGTLVTVPEVFAKVNSTQSPRIFVGPDGQSTFKKRIVIRSTFEVMRKT